MESKPLFSKTELKILVYNKVKSGKSYEQACKEVEKAIDQCKKNNKKAKKEDENDE